MRKPRVAILYQYFHPDDVVSAQQFAGLATGLADRGWDVEAIASNRSWGDRSVVYPAFERWGMVNIRRVFRPPLDQANNLARMASAAWMIAAWSTLAVMPRDRLPDVVVVGTDPVLSVLVAPVIKALRSRTRIAHWCFDVYPEAAVADGMIDAGSPAVRVISRLLERAYRSCDFIADLGPCMKRRLARYGHGRPTGTLTPWALAEPTAPVRVDATVRRELFGDAKLGLLYSGSFGRAHSADEFLELARVLDGTGVRLCFGVRGNRADQLERRLADDSRVAFAGFAPAGELAKRLGAADVHLVSLRPEWSGVVVPSKFWGALAVGRPVLYAGPADSAVARWVEDLRVGWVLSRDSLRDTAHQLKLYAGDSGKLEGLKLHCHRVYQDRFAKERIMSAWDAELRRLLPSASA